MPRRSNGLMNALSIASLACLIGAPLPAHASQSAAPEVATPDHRRYGAWNQSLIGGGGYFMGVSICASEPSVIYAWNDVGGFHRSDDGGDTWRALHGNLPTTRANYYVGELSVDPRDPDTLVVATGYRYLAPTGVYLSTDGGETFENTLVCANATEPERWTGNTLQRDANDPDRIVTVATGGGAYESRDNGRTWQNIGLHDRFPLDLVLDATNASRLWVAAGAFDDYLHRPGEAEAKVVQFEGGLFRTTDGGDHWEQLASAPPDVIEIEQDPDAADTLYAIGRNRARLYVTRDGGESWEELVDGLQQAENPDASRWEPDDEKYQILTATPSGIYCGSAVGTLYELDPQAGSWRKVEREAIHPPAGWWGHLEGQTTDDGAPAYNNVFSAASSLTVSPADPDVWFMTDWYSIWRTDDAGRTWTWATEGMEDTYVQTVDSVPGRPDVVLAGLADIGYFRSVDGGSTFVSRSSQRGITNNVRSLTIPKADPSRVYGTACQQPGGAWWAGLPYRSDDNGVTWRPLPTRGLPELSNDAHHANTILADDGDADRVWLCVSKALGEGAGGLYESTDGGETWQWLDVGLPEGVDFFRHEIWGGGDDLAVGPDGASVAISFAFQNGAGNDKVWHRPAGADRFAQARFDGWPRDVKADPFTPGRFYLATENGPAYRSDDGGATWSPMPLPADASNAFNLIVDRDTPGRLAASTNNGHVLSTDGGDTWQVLDRAIPHRVGFGMGCFAGNRLVVGTGGSGIFWIDVSEPEAVVADADAQR